MNFVDTYNRYAASKRANRLDLWNLCIVTYDAAETETIRHMSDTIGMSVDTVQNWAYVGELITALDGTLYTDPDEREWSLFDLWQESDALSYDHLLQMAKRARRYELPPAEILERLYNAANGGQMAESMARDMDEQHGDNTELLRRDLRTLTRYAESIHFREPMPRVQRALDLLKGRARQAMEGLKDANIQP